VGFVTDVNLLLLQPGAGDDLQGIKRGVVENADIFIINKADGAQLDLAKQTKISYKNAIQLFHHQIVGWTCPVLLTSAINHTGLDAVYQKVIDFQNLLMASDLLETTRRQQELRWFEKQVIEKIKKMVFEHKNVQSAFDDLSNSILTNDINTSTALHEMNKILRSIIQTNS
jgi:LAO/AO transport system kinase